MSTTGKSRTRARRHNVLKAWVKNNAQRFRQARPQDAKHYNKRAYDGSHTQSEEC